VLERWLALLEGGQQQEEKIGAFSWLSRTAGEPEFSGIAFSEREVFGASIAGSASGYPA